MTDQQYAESTQRAQLCRQYINNDNKFFTFSKGQVCKPVYNDIIRTGGFSDYNMHITNPYPDTYSVFLNRPDVQQVLGVNKKWYNETPIVNHYFHKNDWWADSSSYLVPMMQDPKIKVWWYNGEYDFICNWLGEQIAVDKINWNLQPQWDKLKLAPCYYGECKGIDSQKVKFIKFAKAGHMVPYD